jgi:hypothetical protein
MNDPRLKLEMQDGAIVISLPGTDYQSPLAVYFLFEAEKLGALRTEPALAGTLANRFRVLNLAPD